MAVTLIAGVAAAHHLKHELHIHVVQVRLLTVFVAFSSRFLTSFATRGCPCSCSMRYAQERASHEAEEEKRRTKGVAELKTSLKKSFKAWGSELEMIFKDFDEDGNGK